MQKMISLYTEKLYVLYVKFVLLLIAFYYRLRNRNMNKKLNYHIFISFCGLWKSD